MLFWLTSKIFCGRLVEKIDLLTAFTWMIRLLPPVKIEMFYILDLAMVELVE